MSLATLNGHAVLNLHLHMPLRGPWHASVYVDSPNAITGKAVLAIHGMEFHGHVRRGGVEAETGAFHIVGGSGGFAKSATSKSYKNAPVRIVLQDILRAAGETLSSKANANTTATILGNWAILQHACGKCLFQLAEAQGASWRILPDGTTWFGIEGWPVRQGASITQWTDYARGKKQVWPRAPTVLPGDSYEGMRIGAVHYALEEASDLQAQLWEAHV